MKDNGATPNLIIDKLDDEEELPGMPPGVTPQQLEQMRQFAAQTVKMPSYFTPVVSVLVTPIGHIRFSFGDNLHPQVDPVFYISTTLPLEAVRGLHDTLAKIIFSMDQQLAVMKANEALAASRSN